ncbi:hypothetical protein HY388_01790 [Candidatus Daviesbacteria bacterium]|nr:hypothetical protein [Candidatus Daviesbacteria bacterium]
MVDSSRTGKRLITLFVTWKTTLFLVSACAILLSQNSKAFNHFFDYWLMWDGLHYWQITKDGYTSLQETAFFPLLPLLTKALYTIFPFGNILFWGLVLVSLSTVGLVVVFYRLIRLDYEEDIAFRSLVLLLTFPSALFLSAFYTESLFLFLTVSSFYLARQKHWFWASFVCALVTATRPIGIVLAVALIVEYLMSVKFRLKRKNYSWLWLLVAPLGLVAYSSYLTFAFKNPLAFFIVQSDWQRGLSDYPWQIIYQDIIQIFQMNPPAPFLLSKLADFISSILFLALLVPVFRKLRLSYFIYAYGVLMVPLLTGVTTSMFRFVLAAFPMFIIGGILAKDELFYTGMLLVNISLLVIFTVLFISGYWVA